MRQSAASPVHGSAISTTEQGGWQPIETAPRDGTWFVICNASDDRDAYEVGCYDPYMTPEYVEVEGGLFRKQMRSSYDWTGFNNFHRATHWMPLPPPPSHGPNDDRTDGSQEHSAIVKGSFDRNSTEPSKGDQ